METEAATRRAVYTAEKLNTFIEEVFRDSDFYATYRPAFEPALWSGEHRILLEYINMYYDANRRVPERRLAEIELGLEEFGDPEFQGADRDALVAELTDFYQWRTRSAAVTQALADLETGDIGAVQQNLGEAFDRELARGELAKHIGDAGWVAEILASGSDDIVSTGWPTLDRKFGGGWSRGHMNLFVAKTGNGKSIALSNAAINLAKQDLQVLFVTAEMRDAEIGKRHIKMETGLNTFGKMDAEHIAAVLARLENCRCRENIQIVEQFNPTAADIGSLLKQFPNREFDAVVLDYLDLCLPVKPDDRNRQLYDRDDKMAWEMKKMVADHGIVFITAAQTNTNVRDRLPGEEYEQWMIAGGQAKIRVVENAVFMERTDNSAEIAEIVKHNEKEQARKPKKGETLVPDIQDVPEKETTGYKLYFTKSRHSASGGFAEFDWDADHLFIRDKEVYRTEVFAEDGAETTRERLEKMRENNKRRMRRS